MLRELTWQDLDAVSAFLQDEEVMYAWEHAFSADEVSDWLGENIKRYQTDGFSFWAVIAKSSGKLIGVCGPLVETVEGVRRTGIAYIFNKSYWGQGYAEEAAQASVIYALETLGADEVIAEIRPENMPSRRVAECLGMKVQGSFVKTYKGKAMPHLIYALKRENKNV
ncbi:MAG: N-acetyltransferase [Phascolarctobacterium sp.]|nr:MAG: N-acetyltransferase [Phascolarctobacterium sp.]